MKRTGLPVIAAALYLFMYAPIAVVMVYSFNAARDGFVWRGFSTGWYRALLGDPAVPLALRNTLLLASVSTLVSTFVGTLLAVGLTRYWFPAKQLFAWLMYVPVIIPDIVMAVALFLFYSIISRWTGLLHLGLTTMVIAHITFQIPFVATVVRARLTGMDPALEEAAHDLGATTAQTFRHVTLPLALPGVIAGALLAFTLSLDDFIISFFSAGAGNMTVPIMIYAQVKRGVTPEINALSTLIVATSILGTVGVMRFQRWRETAVA